MCYNRQNTGERRGRFVEFQLKNVYSGKTRIDEVGRTYGEDVGGDVERSVENGLSPYSAKIDTYNRCVDETRRAQEQRAQEQRAQQQQQQEQLASNALTKSYNIATYGDKGNERIKSHKKWTIKTLKWMQDEVCPSYAETVEWITGHKYNGYSKKDMISIILDKAVERDWAQSDADRILGIVEEVYEGDWLLLMVHPEYKDMSKLEQCQDRVYKAYINRSKK